MDSEHAGDSSFVLVSKPGTSTLSVSILPKHGEIGVDACTTDRTGTCKITTTLLCVSVKATTLSENDEKRAAVDLVVVLDVSGSMMGRKLALCKRALSLLLRVLLPKDRFGLVVFSNDAQTVIPIQYMTNENKVVAQKAIDALQAYGSTNIAKAVDLATREMRGIDAPNLVQSIFLLTDGLANQGIRSTSRLVHLTKTGVLRPKDEYSDEHFSFVDVTPDGDASRCWRDGEPSISFHTFGYGPGHEAPLLRKMAAVTEGGSYHFIQDDQNVGRAFGSALGGIMSVVAQNTRVSIKVPPQAKAMGVQITKIYNNNQAVQQKDGSYTVPLGDFYADESRDLVLEVELAVPQKPNNKAIPHVAVSLSYTDTLAQCLVCEPDEDSSSDGIVASIVRSLGTRVSEEDPHVAAQSLRIRATQLLEKAERCAGMGNFRAAQDFAHQIQQACQQQSPAVRNYGPSPIIAADADVALAAFSNEGTYIALGSKVVNATLHAHQTQRSAPSYHQAQAAYYSPKRSSWASMFSSM